tara:strand:+ start:196 stop:1701 length:1506 start_codon:yes stop_codon:yes gene_type:complete
MADQKVNIKVTAQGAKKAQGELKGVEGAIGKMGKAVGVASAVYFGARGLIAGFSSVITLAGEQEQAEKKLEVALGKTSQSLLNQATALQKMTTFGDEAIIGVQASIGAFIKNEEQIKKATSATLDIAVAMGMDLKSAGDLVAKTLGSSTNAMSRYGIEVTGAVGSTERLESLTGNVARLFGGQASAEAETLTGKIEQMKNAIGDAGEAIGSLLAPVVISVASNIASLANATGSLVNNFSDIIDGNSLASAEFQLLNTEMKDFKKVTDELGFYSLLEMNNQINDLLSTMPVITPEVEKLMDQQLILAEAMKESTKEIKRQKFELDLNAEIEQGSKLAESTMNRVTAEMELGKIKKQNLEQDLRGAILSGQSAKQAMVSVVRAETMEAVAGLLSSILKTVPYPFNLIAGAGAGALVSGLMDSAMGQLSSVKFAETGFEGVVTKPTMFITGENNKPEQVSVTPLGGESSAGININIQGNMIGNEEFVRDILIPEMSNARNQNLA